MGSHVTTIGFEDARATLGLARWQLHLAIKSGLVAQRPSGRLDLGSVAAAAKDPRFRERLESEELLVSRQAAAILGAPVRRFREAAREGVFTPVATDTWRYGRQVRLYRPAEVRAAADAYRDWDDARRRARLDPDAVRTRAAARRTARATSMMNFGAARVRLETVQTALAGWDPNEAPLVAASFWIGRLAAFRDAAQRAAHNSTTFARQRLHGGRYRAMRDLVWSCWEIVAASGHPAIGLARRPDEVSFEVCPSCELADPAESPPDPLDPSDWMMPKRYYNQPGCPACTIRSSSLGVVIEMNLTGGRLAFEIPLAWPNVSDAPSAASRWTTVGDPRLVRHPFVDARRSRGGAEARSLPGMDGPSFRTMDPDVRQELFIELDRVIDEMRAAGMAPTGLVPAWYPSLPVDPGYRGDHEGAPLGPPWVSSYDLRLTPLERVLEELRSVLGRFPHGFLLDRAIAEHQALILA